MASSAATKKPAMRIMTRYRCESFPLRTNGSNDCARISRCGMISQAIAFNLFLAFFPALLIMVGFATSRIGGRTSLLDLITDLTAFLPPGSQGIVSEFLVKRGPEAWKLALVGWAGTLLAGSQVMRLLMEGIHRIYGDQEKPGFLHRQLRGLVLLLVTIAPLLAAAILEYLGRPIRRWLAEELGPQHILRGWWTIFFSPRRR